VSPKADPYYSQPNGLRNTKGFGQVKPHTIFYGGDPTGPRRCCRCPQVRFANSHLGQRRWRTRRRTWSRSLDGAHFFDQVEWLYGVTEPTRLAETKDCQHAMRRALSRTVTRRSPTQATRLLNWVAQNDPPHSVTSRTIRRRAGVRVRGAPLLPSIIWGRRAAGP
jgi:hypothetical protein